MHHIQNHCWQNVVEISFHLLSPDVSEIFSWAATAAILPVTTIVVEMQISIHLQWPSFWNRSMILHPTWWWYLGKISFPSMSCSIVKSPTWGKKRLSLSFNPQKCHISTFNHVYSSISGCSNYKMLTYLTCLLVIWMWDMGHTAWVLKAQRTKSRAQRASNYKSEGPPNF